MNNRPPDNSTIDEQLRSAYADLPQATTPASLDEKVLRAASDAVKTKPAYSWTQPLAWAATLTLCVAIVVQMPSNAPQPPSVAVGEADSVLPASDSPLLEDADIAAERGENGENAANPAALNFARQRRNDTHSAAASTAARSPNSDAVREAARSADDAAALANGTPFRVQNRDLLQAAEDQANLKNGSPQSAVAEQELRREQISTFSAVAKSAPSHCDDDERSTEEGWIRCIEDLEEAGRADDARDERLRLLIRYPTENAEQN